MTQNYERIGVTHEDWVGLGPDPSQELIDWLTLRDERRCGTCRWFDEGRCTRIQWRDDRQSDDPAWLEDVGQAYAWLMVTAEFGCSLWEAPE